MTTQKKWGFYAEFNFGRLLTEEEAAQASEIIKKTADKKTSKINGGEGYTSEVNCSNCQNSGLQSKEASMILLSLQKPFVLGDSETIPPEIFRIINKIIKQLKIQAVITSVQISK